MFKLKIKKTSNLNSRKKELYTILLKKERNLLLMLLKSKLNLTKKRKLNLNEFLLNF